MNTHREVAEAIQALDKQENLAGAKRRQGQTDRENAEREQIERQLALAREFRDALAIPELLQQAQDIIGSAISQVSSSEKTEKSSPNFSPGTGIYVRLSVHGRRIETHIFDGSVNGWPTSYSKTDWYYYSRGAYFAIALNKTDINAPLELCFLGGDYATSQWQSLAVLPKTAEADLTKIKQRVVSLIAQFAKETAGMKLQAIPPRR